MDVIEFTIRFTGIIPSPTESHTGTWARWAEEMTDFFAGMLDGLDNGDSSIVRFYRLGSTAANNRQELCTAFHNIRLRYGEEICQQIYELAAVPFCLYAWEALDAAEKLRQGADPDDIPDMCEEGRIDLNVPDTPDLMLIDPVESDAKKTREDQDGRAETD